MIISPEFHRQLWRGNLLGVIIAMAVMALFFYGPFSGVWNAKSSTEVMVIIVASTLNLFGFIAIFMTSVNAGTCFAEDVKDGTWDFQRMSSISPWDLAVGRYLGATIVWWGVAFAALAVAFGLYGWVLHENPQLDVLLMDIDFVSRVIFTLLIAVLLGFTSYLMGMAEVSAVRSAALVKPGGASAGTVPVFMYGLLVLEIYNSNPSRGFNFILIPQPGLIEWFGYAFESRVFWGCSLVLFIYWVLAAIYRQAKAELQFSRTAVVWVSFSICMALYGAGFFDGVWAGLVGTSILMALAVVGMGSLVVPGYRGRMISAWRAGNWRRFFENLPGGICSLLLGLVAYAVFMAYVLLTGQGERSWGGYSVAVFATTGALIVLRDSLFLGAVRKAVLEKKLLDNVLGAYFVGLYGALPLISILLNIDDFGNIEGANLFVAIAIQMVMAWSVPSLFSQVMAAGLVFLYAARRERKRVH